MANPRYHGTGPYLQSLIQKVVPDQQVLIRAVPDVAIAIFVLLQKWFVRGLAEGALKF